MTVALGSSASDAAGGEAAGLSVTVAVTVGAGEDAVVAEPPQPATATAAAKRRRASTKAGAFRPVDGPMESPFVHRPPDRPE
jgi:hypothetical protein